MEIVVVALVILLLRHSELLIYSAKEYPYFLEFSEYRYFITRAFFLLLSVLNVFPVVVFFKAVIELIN